MKNRYRHFLQALHYGGVSHVDYRNISPIYNITNYSVWRVICIIEAVLFSALFVNSFIATGLQRFRFLYLGMALFTTIQASIFYRLAKKKRFTFLKLLIYFNSLIIYSFGMLLSLDSAPNELSVAFMVMLVVLPLVILDKPCRLITMTVAVSAIYIVLVHRFKADDIQQTERVNTIVYCLVSCILSTYLVCSRFSGLLEEFRTSQRIYVDALTGLGNELSYLRCVEELNGRIKSGEAPAFAVCMMDLNNVKTTNDTYGHRFGCALIVESGHYIRKHFLTSHCFHVGGDEFIVILEGADYEHREALIKDFDKRMEDYYYTMEGIDLRLVLARGLSTFDAENDMEYKFVFERADALMYENKRYVKQLYGLPQR